MVLFTLPAALIAVSGCHKNPESGEQAAASVSDEKASAKTGSPRDNPTEVGEDAEASKNEQALKRANDEALKREKRLAGKAREALSAVVKAQDALRKADTSAGKKQIEIALTALDALEQAEPSVHFARVMMDSVGEYELDETVPLGPDLVKFQSSVWKDNELVQGTTRDPKKHDGTLRGLVLVDSVLHYESAALPIAASHTRLLAAKELLDRGKTAKALDQLESIVAGVESFDDTIDTPIWVARRMVVSARNAVAQRNEKRAKGFIVDAANILDKTITESGKEKASDKDRLSPSELALATALRTELRGLQKVLASGDTSAAEFRGAKGIGRRLQAAAHHWNVRREVSGTLTELADKLSDALVHVEWASTYQYEDKDTEKTAKYRNKVKEDIADALKAADAAARPAIVRMQSHMKEIEQTSMSSDSFAAEAQYARLAIELRTAIYETR